MASLKLLVLGFVLVIATGLYAGTEIHIANSPPEPPKGAIRPVVDPTTLTRSEVLIEGVPKSKWTYGCSATAAGMLFGYYDRHGYPNMYTGPANGGVAPLINLGQGIYSPISGSCSIIATQQGFDGRTTPGHVDDYWIGTDEPGPDPWTTSGVEHTWGDCTADFMGTNQWKWDDGIWQWNEDGSTIWFYNSDGSPRHDPIPHPSYGEPRTAGCHGMRLFAESRGYLVEENYNQKTDNLFPNGFSFAQFMEEIDAGRPVLIHVTGHSMLGVGYDSEQQHIYLHDTWDNALHYMEWGGYYGPPDHPMEMRAMTVFKLAPPDCNGNGTSDIDDLVNCDGSGWCSDCNGNMLIDICDINNGDSLDCNGNDIPDSCDVTSGTVRDCNANMIPDSCDVDDETSEDTNNNNIPDECEDCNNNSVLDDFDLAACEAEPWCQDCNVNGLLDLCDIEEGRSEDSDGNGIPDECPDANDCNDNGQLDEFEIQNCNGEFECSDCNLNGKLDTCDVEFLVSHDCNGNMIPDECDEDCDNNGIVDECEITYTTHVGTQASAVAISGEYMIVSFGNKLNIMHRSEPGVTVGTVHLLDAAREMVVDSDLVYIAAGKYGLQIVDISDKTAPLVIGNITTPGFARGIALSGEHVYIADNSAGLTVIKISNPQVPAIIATLDTPGFTWDVAITETYAVLADYHQGIQIVDIQNPAAPAYSGTFNTPGYSTGIDIEGRYAYVADRGAGLQIIDIANKTAPSPAGEYDTAGSAWDVEVASGFAYLADYSNGLLVLDVLDPASINLIESHQKGGIVHNVAFDGNCACAANDLYGIMIFDQSQNPDCNGNGMSDTCELTDGVLHDVNNNNVIDECELDQDGDSVVDLLDFAKFQICFGSDDAVCIDQFDLNNDGSVDLDDYVMFVDLM